MSKVLPNSGPGLITTKFNSHHEKFGTIAPSQLPIEGLQRTRMLTPNQEDTEFCTEYGEAVDQGYQKGILMSPEFQVAAAGKYIGSPITAGADPVPSMQATTVNGSLPITFSPFTLDKNGADFIADWTNWATQFFSDAKPYVGSAVYVVDGTGDTFDNIRNALYQAWEAGDKSCVKAFGFWYNSWNEEASISQNKGKLSAPGDSAISRHRYNFIDWIPDGMGDFLLVAALTQGPTFGDNGFLYFTRATVNQVFANLAQNGLGLYIARSDGYSGQGTYNWFESIIQFFTAQVNALFGRTKK